MKKIIVICGVLFSSTLAAQSSNWSGAYGQVGVGYESLKAGSNNTSFTADAGGGANPLNNSMSTINGFTGTISVGYNQVIHSNWLLGLGVDYSPVKSPGGNYTLTDPSGTSSPINGTYKKVAGSYAVFISPSYAIDANKLAYAKLGYAAATLDNSHTKTNHTGYLMGLGYKQIIQGGLYAFGEANYSAYGDSTTSYAASSLVGGVARPGTFRSTLNFSSYNVLLGVGYKF